VAAGVEIVAISGVAVIDDSVALELVWPPLGTAAVDAVSEDAMSEAAAVEAAVSEDAMSEAAAVEAAVSEDAMSEAAAVEAAVLKTGTPEVAALGPAALVAMAVLPAVGELAPDSCAEVAVDAHPASSPAAPRSASTL